MPTAQELQKRYQSLLNKHGINTPLRQSHFWAQIAHESNLKPIQENLNYSSEGLQKTFKKYFPTPESTKGYARNPKAIANKVYANRMGNGNEASGDGWKFRGRGFIQVTGKSNYDALSKDTKIDYTANPDLLLNEADSMVSALWFWAKNGLNELADKNDVLGITKRINGGVNGLAHRTQLVSEYKEIFAPKKG